MWWPFKKRQEIRADTWADIDDSTKEGRLLRAILTGESVMSVEQAMQIPAVAACVNLICNTIAMIPFKLYEIKDDMQLREVTDDKRVRIINADTGDTLDAVQMKKALVKDYLLDKGGYAYIERRGNKTVSLRYVRPGHVSFTDNADPIFKDYNILVNGNTFRPYEFLKILRNTEDGHKGKGITEDNSQQIALAWNTLKYQSKLMATGGAKKGFIKSSKRLTDQAIKALKDAWRRLFTNGSENVIILNEGAEFQESSETSVEMQINESVNTSGKQICQIFGVPAQMINREVGTASEEDRLMFIQYCVQPILTEFENALNRDFLLEKEKDSYKWAADTSELTKADILKRYQAYEVACKNGFMQVDEVRFRENMQPLGLDFVKLGLQDVLYYPEKKQIFVPNMNAASDVEQAMKAQNGTAENENTEEGGGNG